MTKRHCYQRFRLVSVVTLGHIHGLFGQRITNKGEPVIHRVTSNARPDPQPGNTLGPKVLGPIRPIHTEQRLWVPSKVESRVSSLQRLERPSSRLGEGRWSGGGTP